MNKHHTQERAKLVAIVKAGRNHGIYQDRITVRRRINENYVQMENGMIRRAYLSPFNKGVIFG